MIPRAAIRSNSPSGIQPNIETVLAFVAAVNARDAAAIIALFHKDAVYHNIPLNPIRGVAAIASAFSRMIAASDALDWRPSAIAESADDVVLTERFDRFIRGGRCIEVRAMGAFEYLGGLISPWRDYFDLNAYLGQLAPAERAEYMTENAR